MCICIYSIICRDQFAGFSFSFSVCFLPFFELFLAAKWRVEYMPLISFPSRRFNVLVVLTGAQPGVFWSLLLFPFDRFNHRMI